jgi:orotidine-5'-phosphate decarboxylase
MASVSGLFQAIQAKASFLCVGLDPDPAKIPASFGTGVVAMEAFCAAVVESTLPFAVAYKPNLAFFEQYGAEGWAALERVVADIPSDVLVIADAKRGDIGNTALKYAEALFTGLGADAVTVAPYMGRNSVEPFTSFQNKWTVLLALTSNPSAEDFEFHGATPLFEEVLSKSREFEGADRLMYVVGATRPEQLGLVRSLVPDAFLLVPGVGAQGGTVEDACAHGLNSNCGLLVNSSRGILYAGSHEATVEETKLASRAAAAKLQVAMHAELEKAQLL